MSNVYQSGNTVRLECKFYDFYNNPVNPDVVKIILYNYKYEILKEFLVNQSADVGSYYFDYKTEDEPQRLFYEWYGEINGKPSIKRGELYTRFI